MSWLRPCLNTDQAISTNTSSKTCHSALCPRLAALAQSRVQTGAHQPNTVILHFPQMCQTPICNVSCCIEPIHLVPTVVHAVAHRQTVQSMQDCTDPFLAPGAAALGVQVGSLGGPLPAAPTGRGPTGFTAALEASSLKVPLFHGCTKNCCSGGSNRLHPKGNITTSKIDV